MKPDLICRDYANYFIFWLYNPFIFFSFAGRCLWNADTLQTGVGGRCWIRLPFVDGCARHVDQVVEGKVGWWVGYRQHCLYSDQQALPGTYLCAFELGGFFSRKSKYLTLQKKLSRNLRSRTASLTTRRWWETRRLHSGWWIRRCTRIWVSWQSSRLSSTEAWPSTRWSGK